MAGRVLLWERASVRLQAWVEGSPGRIERWLPAAGAVLFALLALGLSFWRWWSFQYRTFDLAFYVQALWLTMRGHSFGSLLGTPLLGNHAEPIVYLALPLFALCPHPMLLPALQIAALASMPFTARRIARRLGLGERPALALALATLLAPATGFIAIHEFHPEAFAAPLLLLLYEARRSERWRRYAFWFLLTLACKENVALLLVAWSLVFAWVDRSRRPTWRLYWNNLPLIVAVGWLIVYASWLSPWLNGGRVDYASLYSDLGSSAGDMLLKFFVQPGRFWGSLARGLTEGNLVGAMVLSTAGLVIFRPRWLLIASPILLQHLLSWRSSEWTIDYHYAAPLVPLFWLAAAETAAAWDGQPIWAFAPAAVCVALQPLLGPVREFGPEWQARRANEWNRAWKAPLVEEIAAQPALTVVCGMPYLSHLAKRGSLYSLHLVLKGMQTLSLHQRYVPDYEPDVAILDYGDSSTFSKAGSYYHPPGVVFGVPLPSSDQLLNAFLSRESWSSQSVNELTILRRSASPAPAAPSPEPTTTTGDRLLSVRGTRETDSRHGTLDLEWQFAQPRRILPWERLELHGPAGTYALLLGMAAPEVAGPGAREHRAVRLPPWLPAGTYQARVMCFDQIHVFWGKENRNASLGGMNLGTLTVQ